MGKMFFLQLSIYEGLKNVPSVYFEVAGEDHQLIQCDDHVDLKYPRVYYLGDKAGNFTGSIRLRESMWDNGPKLGWVGTPAAGIDNKNRERVYEFSLDDFTHTQKDCSGTSRRFLRIPVDAGEVQGEYLIMIYNVHPRIVSGASYSPYGEVPPVHQPPQYTPNGAGPSSDVN